MRELSKKDLENVKELLFMGLDFVSTDLADHLDDYIRINRSTFTDPKIGGGRISGEMFDQWIKEWMSKNRIIVIDDL